MRFNIISTRFSLFIALLLSTFSLSIFSIKRFQLVFDCFRVISRYRSSIQFFTLLTILEKLLYLSIFMTKARVVCFVISTSFSTISKNLTIFFASKSSRYYRSTCIFFIVSSSSSQILVLLYFFISQKTIYVRLKSLYFIIFFVTFESTSTILKFSNYIISKVKALVVYFSIFLSISSRLLIFSL